MFSRRQPHLLNETTSNTRIVEWADIARKPTYDPVPQPDGTYHLDIFENSTIKLSKFDHDFLKTTMPHQIVDLTTYPDDLRAELSLIALAKEQLASWKDIAHRSKLRLSETWVLQVRFIFITVLRKIDEVVSLLSDRGMLLQRPQPHDNAMQNAINTSVEPKASPAETNTSRTVQGRKRRSKTESH